MNNYYSNNDSRLNEARTMINQMSVEELTKLMNNDDEVTKFVRNLPAVCCNPIVIFFLKIFLRFNKWRQLKKI